ncbi:MAG: hypothetical protein QME96_15210 [Myxococcota bacterium]|nr:hypothetical protein [Myxococcota bacterium]
MNKAIKAHHEWEQKKCDAIDAWAKKHPPPHVAAWIEKALP